MDTPETSAKTEEPQAASVDNAPAPKPEEPIILRDLFPKAEKDLDALFPEPGLKKLLKDVVKTREKNERFLKRMNLSAIPPEEED